MMKTISVQAEVTADQILKIEVPCDLAPGQVEVLLTVQPRPVNALTQKFDWNCLFGLGREVWQAVDASAYLDALRADREPGT